MRRTSFIIFVIILGLLLAALSKAQPESVAVVEIHGGIDEGKVYLVKKGLSIVNGGILILVIDSYGGYVKSMDEIISLLKTCQCRTIAFLPPGSKAVSAATGVALAASKLYVGDGAVIGACKPTPSNDKTEAYMISRFTGLLEEKKVQKPDLLARELVVENKAFTAREALDLGLADARAGSLGEVLRAEGLEGLPISYFRDDLVSEALSLLIDPGIALLLAVLGVLLLALEFHVTGFQGWGVIGGALILTALYTFNLIGINLYAFLLVSLGVVLILLELFKPGIQVFGLSGGLLVGIGIAVEYYTQPYHVLSSFTVTALVLLGLIGVFIALIIYKASQTLRMKTLSLEEKLIGKTGYAKTGITPGKRGVVYVEGEDWTAESDDEIREGQRIIVEAVRGLVLKVRPAESK
jgi:membrane-bound serine protease (ClpP class)